ncbi:MAG: undecaprenyl/decaprenyl-phosphate alpha-N-acetylglucosaminyl 1-phosphate transferase [Firmicutes bacterium]|nr:undecaprenyl/decaprenyl-phosphate alpha-N-acetylglucosaminyl 1-phosphate transferase [Bacillota bacterium]
MSQYLLLFCLAFFVSYIVTPLTARLAFIVGAVDRPNMRKVHDSIMPRLGGIAIFAGFSLATAVYSIQNNQIPGIMLGGVVILLIGIADDIRDISPKVKLLGQCLAALVVVQYGIQIEFIHNVFAGYLQVDYLTVPLSVFWIVAVTNAVNLIDGLDGLASGITAIALTTFAVIAYQSGQNAVFVLSIILVGAVLGFLRFNFFPAKIFLGDSGSMFLGFMLAVLPTYGVVKGATAYALIIPIIILAVPLLDTGYAIIRRYLEKKPIFQADRQHIHHRLLNHGLSHLQAVLMIYAISVFLSFSALLVFYSTSPL